MKPAFELTLFMSLMAWAFCGYAAAQAEPVLRHSSAASAPPKGLYDGVVARQTSSWGIYTVKACSAGIRIETQNKAICVAQPPDWTIHIFRKGQKRAAKVTYAMFGTKNPHAINLSQMPVKPYPKRLAGVSACQFLFDVNKRMEDTSMGGLYLSRQSQPIVLKKEFVLASGIDCVPNKAKGVWSNYFEVPILEQIPLQVILHLQNGEKREHFDTKKFSFERLSADDFKVPQGLSYTAQFAEMIYGKEMEGVADLLAP